MTQTRKRQRLGTAGAEGEISKLHALYADYTPSADPRHQFVEALIAAGIPPSNPGEIVADGAIHRIHIEGDKRGSRNGWCVLFAGRIPCGAYGSWRAGVSGTWRARQAVTPIEQEELHRRMESARAARKAELHRRHEEAAARAARLWREAYPADPTHPYLVRKRVQPHRARQIGDRLVLPVFDFGRRIRSLQFIDLEGGKRLLTGGAKQGNVIPVDGRMPGASRVLVCEGWATGATLAEAEPGALVLAAIDAGNLEPVAIAARREWPDTEIVVCCDADPVGVAKGRAAAIAAGALVAVPEFPEGAQGSDFNDLAKELAHG